MHTTEIPGENLLVMSAGKDSSLNFRALTNWQ